VAIVIATFLLAGLFSILQSTKDTSSNQTALAGLQDSERIAATILTDVIQEAGYYPNASTVPIGSAFQAAGAFAQGQLINGPINTVSTTYGDTIDVRYQGDGTNTVLDCTGSTVVAGAAHDYHFWIEPVNNVPTLVCSKDGTPEVALVSPINSMTILYGVDTAATTPNASGTVNNYLPAASLSAVNWTNIYSVKIVLTFPNPLLTTAGGKPQPGQQLTPTITFSRVISIMSKTGVNVSSFT